MNPAPLSAADPVTAALAALRRGALVLVVDDENRENEGDLIMAAEMATADSLAFMIRHTTGLICVAVTGERADELDLPLMVSRNDDPQGTAFTVSVDRKELTTTGVSAADRAATIRALADPATRADQLGRPGHIFPLRARPGGVLERGGHTESAVDLCRLAGLSPVGVLAEVVNDDGTMARRPQLTRFAIEHDLTLLSVADIRHHRALDDGAIHCEASARIPSRYGEFTAMSFRTAFDTAEHVAMVFGDVDQREAPEESRQRLPVLTRVHSECMTGDVFGSMRCDCGSQLEQAMARIGKARRGVIIYLRNHEGRGIGLSRKLHAYALQDQGLDTVDANLVQGLPADARNYEIAAWILHKLGVQTIDLMTNNPDKCRDLGELGLVISTREPLMVSPNPHNLAYLTAKRNRMGHLLGEGMVM
jgi:3,4-dihydroxy 2-butanone 4-phosphate synthase/GTP cyclohydrolase II